MNTSKIIKGVVSNGRYTVTAPIVKEDYGLYLQIEGVELPSTYEVDFSNSENSGTSVTMIGNSDGVLIPHQFIETGKDVFAFLYHVGADYGRTVYKFRIPNKLRPDRTNEEPTPEEQSVIDQCISALNEAVAQTAQDVESADQSVQSAQGYAEQAESARDTAQTYANNASASATSASESATASANSATASANSASQSAQIKADVEGMVSNAQGYANSASQSANASANSASYSQGYAQSASASASSASGYATSAQSSANTASSKASEASTSAQTASDKATEASQSATTASNKASEASGYATSAQTAQGKAEDAQTAAETAQGLAESARDDAIQAKNDAESAVASISGALADKAPVITDTALGAIASFSDGADDLPLKSLVVNIDPVQDLSQGDPSPTNICPISGWTQVGVEQRGKNVWDEEWGLGTFTANHEWGTGSYLGAKNPVCVVPNVTYYNFCPSGVLFVFYNSNGEYIEEKGVASNSTFTAPSGATTMRFRTFQAYGTTYNHDISINYPSTDHDYHPYTGRSITIDLGQTVYGGKLDVLSGKLVIDMAMVDLGTLSNWWKAGTNNADTYRYTNKGIINTVKKPSTNSIQANIVCSSFKAITGDLAYLRRDGVGITKSGDISIYDSRYDKPENTTTEFKTAMNGVMLCYELAEPIEIQLDSHTLNSLYGVNNIWADTGDTEAEYRADTKLYIERLTAPDSADMIADANITSGKYFMVGNNLYKATANIANGSAIVVGTNCIRKSLSEALNEINA